MRYNCPGSNPGFYYGDVMEIKKIIEELPDTLSMTGRSGTLSFDLKVNIDDVEATSRKIERLKTALTKMRELENDPAVKR